MADLGIAIVQSLIEIVGSEIIQEICDLWGYRSQLEDLKKTTSTIKNVLIDAEATRELSQVARGYIEDLKDAVYDADDLFDEFFTLAELKQLQPQSNAGKFSEKVRRFFSSKNKVGQAYRMSRQVKEIKKRLDEVADNHKKFGFNVDYKPISRRREETCSYVDEKGIIGREDDKMNVIDMLLDPSIDEDFCFLTIVGVGGLGKTALAQLVYNDEKIRNEFPSFRLWVCVSDQDGEQFDVKAILCKILELLTHPHHVSDATATMEYVQHLFQDKLSGHKYFLVLDDVWNENRDKWLKLKSFLQLGQRGSRIVVTTRSETSATIIGDKHTYKLEGLSRENSWHLFKMSAFTEGQEQENHFELIDIGRNIVEKCHNIPLAIKVVGSLLYGQEISRWRSFEESGLAEVRKGQNEIMSILKLSYHNLDSSLKSCFSYCAVFPKDFRIRKKKLISLWMAQGYIVPFDGCQSIEEAGEEHFFILLRRCFFQDIWKRNGLVDSVKIHDLMHDVAQEVGGNEFCVVNSIANRLNAKTRHVSFVGEEYAENSSSRAKMRSFIHYNKFRNFSLTELDKWTCLRVLELHHLSDGSSLSSIDKLMHLRYLNLTENNFEVLPDSITKLHNLQTLMLSCSNNLTKLPKNFCNLVKLRYLELTYCNKLASMPSGMNKLTSLRMLPFFVVGKSKIDSDENHYDGDLCDLKALTNLSQDLHIKIYNSSKEGTSDKEGEILKNTSQLGRVEIEFDCTFDGSIDSEAMIEKLEPHRNIKGFTLTGFKGRKIPRWGRAEDSCISLPNLVMIEFTCCQNLEQIPLLSKLQFLKSLVLFSLDSLEYIEDGSHRNIINAGDSAVFFPSLEYLHISNLTHVKGWRRPKGSVVVDDALSFPRLSTLKIKWCFNLTTFPPCPNLKTLELLGNTEIFGNIVNINSVNKNSYLRNLTIEGLKNLRLSGMEHLTALERLVISGNEEMSITDFEDDIFGMPWNSLQHSLHSLTFESLCNMKTLPAGMQNLSSLRSLQISRCDTLTALPEWIGYLSSLKSMSIRYCEGLKSLPESMKMLNLLQRLEIGSCPYLEERCRDHKGEDWPKIKHIPHVNIMWV